MPNGLDAKVNGSGTTHRPGDAPAAGPSNGNGGAAGHAAPEPDAALSGLALANLPFVEELYFQFLSDPASVDPSWRRYFQSLNGNGAGNGAGAAALVPPAAFRRSIFAGGGAAVPSGAGIAGSRISVRLLSERVQRLVEAYRELGHLTANLDPLGPRAAQAAADRARGLRARGRGSGPRVQQRKRGRPGPDDAARSGRPAARDVQPHASASSWPTCTTSSCGRGC